MPTQRLISNLVKIAGVLDKKGAYKSADLVINTIYKIASMDDLQANPYYQMTAGGDKLQDTAAGRMMGITNPRGGFWANSTTANESPYGYEMKPGMTMEEIAQMQANVANQLNQPGGYYDQQRENYKRLWLQHLQRNPGLAQRPEIQAQLQLLFGNGANPYTTNAQNGGMINSNMIPNSNMQAYPNAQGTVGYGTYNDYKR